MYKTENNLPDFNSVHVETITSTFTSEIQRYKEEIEQLAKIENPTWDNFMVPHNNIYEEYHCLISPVNHLTSVADNDEIREQWENVLPIMSEFGIWASQHEGTYNAIKKIKETEWDNLDEYQQRVVQKAVDSYRLSGINLPDDKKERYAEIKNRLSELSNNFGNNVLDATKAWTKLVGDKDLAGVPDRVKEILKSKAEEKGLDGYLITLDAPVYGPILQYAEDRNLREEVYIAFATKASDKSQYKKYDNSEIIKEMLELRQEAAEMLDFKNHAEVSLYRKMAETTDEVLNFLYDIADKARPKAEKDNEELRRFAYEDGYDIEPWDRSYYADKLQEKKYSFTDEEVREYFEHRNTINGLFTLAEKLFGLKINQVKNDNVWHEDVTFYEVSDNGSPIAYFYMDLFARSTKRGGAWMDEPILRFKKDDGSVQLPVAYLNCNFSPLVDGKSYLSHYEIETLFHEFGHCLHHMLTKMDIPGITGINGVEWDAVELPSQIMENWCWDYDTLTEMSSHKVTGEKLPKELFDKMVNAKHFLSGLGILRQMEFSIFDFELHVQNRPVRDVLNEVRDRVAVVGVPEYNRFENSFSHIFNGGYSAGYYSYTWSLALACDAFTRFKNEGLYNVQIGKEFREAVLERGGSRPTKDNFNDFMGRDMDITAYLHDQGIL